MDFTRRIDTISMDWSIVYFKGSQAEISTINIFLFLKIVFILENGADSGEMPPYATYRLSIHYLQKYLFTGRLRTTP